MSQLSDYRLNAVKSSLGQNAVQNAKQGQTDESHEKVIDWSEKVGHKWI